MISKDDLSFRPLNKDNWADFERLFGERGACGGCWCMSWRLPRSEFDCQKGSGNKAAMKQLVENGGQIGIITYYNEKPIAWCAVAPREVFVRLNSSRVLKRIDDEPVWSIPCFFITKEFRRLGLSVAILKGVIAQCKEMGVKILEAYPIIPYSKCQRHSPGAVSCHHFKRQVLFKSKVGLKHGRSCVIVWRCLMIEHRLIDRMHIPPTSDHLDRDFWGIDASPHTKDAAPFQFSFL